MSTLRRFLLRFWCRCKGHEERRDEQDFFWCIRCDKFMGGV